VPLGSEGSGLPGPVRSALFGAAKRRGEAGVATRRRQRRTQSRSGATLRLQQVQQGRSEGALQRTLDLTARLWSCGCDMQHVCDAMARGWIHHLESESTAVLSNCVMLYAPQV
jgi:hypothetical protein